MRQEFRAHADPGIRHGKHKGCLAAEPGSALHEEFHISALRSKFHRIAQDIDQHLSELHVVPDVIIVHFIDDAAVVSESLILALAAEHHVDRFQKFAEGELLVPERHAPGFDSRHVQDIIDETQEVLRGSLHFLQIFDRFWRRIRHIHGDVAQSDNRIHGRADLMAHTGQEGRLRLAGLLSPRKRVA